MADEAHTKSVERTDRKDTTLVTVDDAIAVANEVVALRFGPMMARRDEIANSLRKRVEALEEKMEKHLQSGDM